MKAKSLKKAIILLSITLVLAVPVIVFFFRAPVLIVCDLVMTQIYGEKRVRRENIVSSLVLFRPVKNAVIADDAGDDIVQFAVSDVSGRPFCVLFPYRFERSARIYKGQNPDVLTVLLSGRENSLNLQSDGFYSYKTDIEADFFKAGLAAAFINSGENGHIACLFEPNINAQERLSFIRGLEKAGSLANPEFFTAFSEITGSSGYSCVVIAGTGAEYLEEKPGIPGIFFTWIDPALLPGNTVLVIDDSPWAQTVQAFKFAAAGAENAVIPSKIRPVKNEKFSIRSLRKALKIG